MKCPYCLEEVQDGALLCKHCSKKLDTRDAKKKIKEMQEREKIEQEKKKEEQEKKQKEEEKESKRKEEEKQKAQEIKHLIQVNKEKIKKYPEGTQENIKKDLSFLRKLEKMNDEDIKKDIIEMKNSDTSFMIGIPAFIALFFDPFIVSSLILLVGIWIYPNRDFSHLKEIKKHSVKILFSVLFIISICYGVYMRTLPAPTLNVISPIENGKNTQYTLKFEIENSDQYYINGDLTKDIITKKIVEKDFNLENTETKIKIEVKNGYYKSIEKEIVVKRDQTDEEVEKVKQEEEEKARVQAEKEKMQAEKQEKEKAELPEKKFKANRAVLEMMCEKAIKRQLKAPSTAKFSGVEAKWTGLKGTEALVIGKVDSQNSFGAMIRSSFSCRFQWTGNDYKIISAKLLD